MVSVPAADEEFGGDDLADLAAAAASLSGVGEGSEGGEEAGTRGGPRFERQETVETPGESHESEAAVSGGDRSSVRSISSGDGGIDAKGMQSSGEEGMVRGMPVLAMVSLGCAIAAGLICWIPYVGIVAPVLAIVGLVLGIVSAIMVLAHRGGRVIWYPIVGAALSFGVLALSAHLISASVDRQLGTVSGLLGSGEGGTSGQVSPELLRELEQSMEGLVGRGGGAVGDDRSRIPRVERSEAPARSDSEGSGPERTRGVEADAGGEEAPSRSAADGGGEVASEDADARAAPQGGTREQGDGGAPGGEERWVGADEPNDYGPVRVRVRSVVVGRVRVEDILGNRRMTREPVLEIALDVHNRSANQRIIEFMSWMGPGLALNENVNVEDLLGLVGNARSGGGSLSRVKLMDNFGNRYRLHATASTDLLMGGGGLATRSIRPHEKVTDSVLFEEPLDGVEYLRLELPARHFGGEGMLRFEIPAEMIERR